MLIVLFIVFLIIAILLLLLASWADYHDHELTDMLSCFGIVGAGIAEFIIIISIICNIVGLTDLKVADKKIAMYEEENSNIQNQVSEIVKNYQDYEKNTYSESLKNVDLSNTDVVVLAQLYPDLKADEMVKKQIEIYQDNNNKIKELKEQKINNELCKWWLYFGEEKEVKEDE